MPTSRSGFLPSRNGLTTTVQWSCSPSSPILCATALRPRTLPDRPAQTRDLTNHHDAKVRWERLLDHRPGRPIPIYSRLRTFRPEEALESMSRMALSAAYALTPRGITMDSPKGIPITALKTHHQCSICHNVKSHPVSYLCGHSHCYVCIRLWLEKDWKCPNCATTMHREPVRQYAEEDYLEDQYPGWDVSRVEYKWDGLMFPKFRRMIVVPDSP
ncbi:hypothetical protein FB451DRAFT_1399011 [Mycena latifolia]|nr:hypothetical protein FB451DRAFT_1399011 [Mycena latifolia]